MLRFGQCYYWSEHTNVLFQKCWHKHHRKMSSNTEEGKNNKKSGGGVTVWGWGRGGQWKPEWSVWYSEGRVVRCRCREHKVSVVKHHWARRWVIILNLWILLLRIRRDVPLGSSLRERSRRGCGWWRTGAQAAGEAALLWQSAWSRCRAR